MWVEAALVADADGVTVVAPAVGSYFPQRTTFVDLSVDGDVIVITDVAVTASQVVLPALLEGVSLPDLCGRAVQDDESDGTQNKLKVEKLKS